MGKKVLEIVTEEMNYDKVREMEKQLGCTFCTAGECAEMVLRLENYTEQTQPI